MFLNSSLFYSWLTPTGDVLHVSMTQVIKGRLSRGLQLYSFIALGAVPGMQVTPRKIGHVWDVLML